MSKAISCAVCGGENNSDASFCKFCGSPIEGSAEVVESATVSETKSVPRCSQCGAPIKNPDQRFCGSCGTVLSSEEAIAPVNQAAAPVKDVALSVADSTGVPSTLVSSADSVKDGLSKASAKLDSFMGATLDLDAVGKDFDPSSIDLKSISAEEIASAFSYFGKSLADPVAEEVVVLDMPEDRRSSEEGEDKAPSVKDRKDFSAKTGAAVFGALSSQLHAEFAPKVEMIAERRGKAASKEKTDRLKHKVDLGDMEKRTAVEQAKE